MYHLRRLLRQWRRRYEPLIRISVSREHLLFNLHTFQMAYPSLSFAPVLKSNAYGHGLIEVAEVLDGEGAPFYCIDSYFEAEKLRRAGIRTPLLILGYTPAETIAGNTLKRVAFTVIGLDHAEAVAAIVSSNQDIHLKIDSGMGRHGVMPQEFEKAVAILAKNGNVRITGVLSHLADSENDASPQTVAQIKIWNEIAVKVRKLLPNAVLHVGNTGGAKLAGKVVADVSRLGLGLYGIPPEGREKAPLDLRPALEVTTKISTVKKIRKGDLVGYNGTFAAASDLLLALIPAGYFEGLDRRLSNKGSVSINGIPVPIVGRISMNITATDASRVPDVKMNDPVTLISRDPKAGNSVESIAKLCDTIPYDILVHIPEHLQRVVE